MEKSLPTYPYIPQVRDIVSDYNEQFPRELLNIVQQEEDVFVLRFDYYSQPSLLQLERLKQYFESVECIEIEDEDCGTLYPIYCKYKPA